MSGFSSPGTGAPGYVGGSLGHAPVNPEMTLKELLALARLNKTSKGKKAKVNSKAALRNMRINGFKDKYGSLPGFGGNYLPGREAPTTGAGII